MFVVRAEIDEKVEGLIDDLLRARILAIDLVHDDDCAQVELERFAQNEAGLRHHAFGSVDQQQDPLHHLQHALDLTAEVGVSRRVDDVELDVAVADRGVLRENRDAALALERIGIEDARRDLLAFSEDAALFEHRVDERRLAVVDVGDDRDVTDIGASFHRSLIRCVAPVHFGSVTSRCV